MLIKRTCNARSWAKLRVALPIKPIYRLLTLDALQFALSDDRAQLRSKLWPVRFFDTCHELPVARDLPRFREPLKACGLIDATSKDIVLSWLNEPETKAHSNRQG